jgi:hypothetical protein
VRNHEASAHSPQAHGIKTVLFTGAELYWAENENLETVTKYGCSTDDWTGTQPLHCQQCWQGVGLRLVINLCCLARPAPVRRADDDPTHGVMASSTAQ